MNGCSGEIGERRCAREAPRFSERARTNRGAEIGARQRKAHLRVTDLVERGVVRGADEIGRRPEREELQRELAEAGDARVLVRGVGRPRAAEVRARRRVEVGDVR